MPAQIGFCEAVILTVGGTVATVITFVAVTKQPLSLVTVNEIVFVPVVE